MENKQIESESSLIWKEIQNLPISLFALPDQSVKDFVKKISDAGDQLIVKIQTGAVLPALEITLENSHLTKGKKYNLELVDGFVIITNRKSSIDNARKIISNLKNK